MYYEYHSLGGCNDTICAAVLVIQCRFLDRYYRLYCHAVLDFLSGIAACFQKRIQMQRQLIKKCGIQHWLHGTL